MMMKDNNIKTFKDGCENEIDFSFSHAGFSALRAAMTVHELNTKAGVKRRSCGEEEHSKISNKCEGFSDLFFFSGSFRFVWEEAVQRSCKRGGKTGRMTRRAEFTPRSAVARPAACRREATWASS